MKVEIKNTNTLDGNLWVRWFMYGATGSGKTTAAATFPAPLFIVPKNEMSVVTLAGRNVPYIEVTDRASMGAAIAYIKTQYAKNAQRRRSCVSVGDDRHRKPKPLL